MSSNLKALVAFGAGFVGGWAARSLSDSPQGVGVKLMEIAMNAKERIDHWAAVERERVEDMVAEAKSRKSSARTGASKGKTHSSVRAVSGDA